MDDKSINGKKTTGEKYKPVNKEEALDWKIIFQRLDILRRRKFIIIQVLSIILLGGYINTRMTTPLYSATSKAIVLPKSQIIQRGETYIYTPTLSIASQLEMLRASDVGEKISKLMLEKNKISISPGSVMGSFSVSNQKENDELVIINVINTDPECARLIANYAADEFVEKSRDFDSAKMRKSRQLIEEQLSIVEKDLTDAEVNLKIFQKKEGIIDVAAEIDAKEKNLIELKSSQSQASVEGNVAQAKLKEIQTSIGLGLSIDQKDPLVAQLEVQLAQNEIDLAGLQQKWSDDHPDVRNAKSKVEETRKKLQEAYASQKTTAKNQLLITQSVEVTGSKARNEGLLTVVEEENEYLKTLPEKLFEMKSLMRAVDVAETKHKVLLEKAQEARIEEATQQGNVEVVSYADLPRWPFKPNMMKNMHMSFLFGLFLGIIIAFLVEKFNMPLSSEEEISRVLNLQVLEVIPKVKFSSKSPLLIENQSTGSKYVHLKESFRSLRTVLNFAIRGDNVKTIVITSSIPSEGKSTIACNLAISYAQMGKRVYLVEADLLRPCLHKIFRIKSEKGLGDYLSDESMNCSMISYDTMIPGLTLLPAGKNIKFTSELIESPRMKEFIKKLKEDKDIDLIIFDCPPCHPVTDGVILSSLVDKVIMVVSTGMNANTVQHSIKLLENAQADIVGVVLNKMDMGRGSSYYKYGYYYSGEKKTSSEEEDKNELIFDEKKA